MAFTLTVDDSTVIHTRAYGLHGVHRHGSNNHADNLDPDYQDQIVAMAPEHIRQDTHGGGVNAGGGVYVVDAKALVQRLADDVGTKVFAKILGTVPGASTSVDITSDAGAQNPSNIGGDGTGWSPKNVVDVVADWRADGIDVDMFAHYNEIANQYKLYFGNVGDRAQTWSTMIERLYADELHGRFGSLVRFVTGEHTAGRASGVNTGQPYRDIDSYLEKGLRATANWPHGDAGNWENGHQDQYDAHGYCKTDFQTGATQDQLTVNSCLFAGVAGDPVGEGTGRQSLQVVRNIRERLDHFGLTDIPIGITEFAIDEGNLDLATWHTLMPLVDWLAYLEALVLSRTHNLRTLTLHNITPKSTAESMFLGRNPWTFSIRGTTYRDMIRRFFHDAYDVIDTQLTGGHTTPGSNGVQAIRHGALLNAAGDECRVGIGNADLATSEAGVIDLAFQPTGDATRIALTSGLGDGASPSVSTVPLSQGSNAVSVPSQTGYLYIIPRDAAAPSPPAPGTERQKYGWRF